MGRATAENPIPGSPEQLRASENHAVEGISRQIKLYQDQLAQEIISAIIPDGYSTRLARLALRNAGINWKVYRGCFTYEDIIEKLKKHK